MRFYSKPKIYLDIDHENHFEASQEPNELREKHLTYFLGDISQLAISKWIRNREWNLYFSLSLSLLIR